MTIHGIEITYIGGATATFETDREPWTFKGMLCIGGVGNFDMAEARRVPASRVQSYNLLFEPIVPEPEENEEEVDDKRPVLSAVQFG